MIYRKAKPKDAKGIANVLLKNYNIKDKQEALTIAKKEIKDFNCIVAENKGRIVGISCWRIHGLLKHQLVQSVRLAIMPNLRGKRVATKLFETMVQDADKFYKANNQKIRKMYAFAHSSNKLAQKFYKDRGFIHEATLKDHYYKGEDEFVYSMFFE